jgi:GntR family transcriptional repressor for pyruvate dehydrogenase complex
MSASFPTNSRLYQEVVDHIQQQILTGALRPGDRLPPERTLVQQYGISRTAVREALRSLAAKGLVESQVGRGTFVRKPTTDHLADKFRLVLGDQLRAEDLESTFYFALTALAETVALRGELDSEATRVLESSAEAEDVFSPAFVDALAIAAPNAVLGTLLSVLSRLCEKHQVAPRLRKVSTSEFVRLLKGGDVLGLRALLGDQAAANQLEQV